MLKALPTATREIGARGVRKGIRGGMDDGDLEQRTAQNVAMLK